MVKKLIAHFQYLSELSLTFLELKKKISISIWQQCQIEIIMSCQVSSLNPQNKIRQIAPGALPSSRNSHKAKFVCVKFDLITQTIFHIAGIFCSALAVKGR